MVRKLEASREVWAHLTGVIDSTVGKYAASRPGLKEAGNRGRIEGR